MPRKRRHKAGNLNDLRRVLWDAILEVESLFDVRPLENDIVLRSANSLSQLAGSYAKLVENTEILERVAKLEKAMGAKI